MDIDDAVFTGFRWFCPVLVPLISIDIDLPTVGGKDSLGLYR